MSLLLTERLIQRQINHWNRMRAYLRQEDKPSPATHEPVITVSRLAGSGGRIRRDRRTAPFECG